MTAAVQYLEGDGAATAAFSGSSQPSTAAACVPQPASAAVLTPPSENRGAPDRAGKGCDAQQRLWRSANCTKYCLTSARPNPVRALSVSPTKASASSGTATD